MSYTIFTIDFEHNPLKMNVFHNFLNDTGVGFKPVIGCYNDTRENAYIVSTDDFDAHIRDTLYIKDQESVMHVASGNKMETVLEYLNDCMYAKAGTHVAMGCMHVVCEDEAMQSPSWSYRPDIDTYWIAKWGNPDGSYARSLVEYSDVPVFDNSQYGNRVAAE